MPSPAEYEVEKVGSVPGGGVTTAPSQPVLPRQDTHKLVRQDSHVREEDTQLTPEVVILNRGLVGPLVSQASTSRYHTDHSQTSPLPMHKCTVNQI